MSNSKSKKITLYHQWYADHHGLYHISVPSVYLSCNTEKDNQILRHRTILKKVTIQMNPHNDFGPPSLMESIQLGVGLVNGLVILLVTHQLIYINVLWFSIE